MINFIDHSAHTCTCTCICVWISLDHLECLKCQQICCYFKLSCTSEMTVVPDEQDEISLWLGLSLPQTGKKMDLWRHWYALGKNDIWTQFFLKSVFWCRISYKDSHSRCDFKIPLGIALPLEPASRYCTYQCIGPGIPTTVQHMFMLMILIQIFN